MVRGGQIKAMTCISAGFQRQTTRAEDMIRQLEQDSALPAVRCVFAAGAGKHPEDNGIAGRSGRGLSREFRHSGPAELGHRRRVLIRPGRR